MRTRVINREKETSAHLRKSIVLSLPIHEVVPGHHTTSTAAALATPVSKPHRNPTHKPPRSVHTHDRTLCIASHIVRITSATRGRGNSRPAHAEISIHNRSKLYYYHRIHPSIQPTGQLASHASPRVRPPAIVSMSPSVL